jgi:hypothetical protein
MGWSRPKAGAALDGQPSYRYLLASTKCARGSSGVMDGSLATCAAGGRKKRAGKCSQLLNAGEAVTPVWTSLGGNVMGLCKVCYDNGMSILELVHVQIGMSIVCLTKQVVRSANIVVGRHLIYYLV